MIKPIAFITGYRDGYPVVQPTDDAAVLPVGMALYANPAADVQPVALEKVYETIVKWDEDGGKRSRRELAKQIIDLYTHPLKPLTVKQIDELILPESGVGTVTDFVRMVEEAHGIRSIK